MMNIITFELITPIINHIMFIYTIINNIIIFTTGDTFK